MISTEIHWDLEKLGAIEDAWRALDARGNCDPSTSLSWTKALLAAHMRPDDTAFAVVVRDAGEVIAIVPAFIRRERFVGAIEVETLRPMCELTTAQSDLLRSSDRPDVVPVVVEALSRLPRRWDMMRISRMLEASPVATQMANGVRTASLPHRLRREQPSFFLELGGSYDDFLAARSSKFRNFLRRKERQLEAAGGMTIRWTGSGLGVEESFSDLLSIEERSWKHVHGTSISAVARQRVFYRKLCEEAYLAGSLRLMLMYLNGVPIAYNLGLTAADRYSYLKTSFDEAQRKLSPATVLRARLVESLIREGVRLLDFPAEPYQWEEQWTRTFRWHTSLVVFNRTLSGRLCRRLVGLRDLVRRASPESRIVYVDPRRQFGA